VHWGKLCLDEGKGVAVCCQISIAGNKIEFRGARLEGLLEAQQKRGSYGIKPNLRT
jgi:hypothetical protein